MNEVRVYDALREMRVDQLRQLSDNFNFDGNVGLVAGESQQPFFADANRQAVRIWVYFKIALGLFRRRDDGLLVRANSVRHELLQVDLRRAHALVTQ